MTRVYLAGPITGLTYGGATSWREYVTSVFAEEGAGLIEVLSPMRGKDFILKRIGAEERLAQTYDVPLSTGKALVGRDRHDVQNSDVVLFNLSGAEKVSIGSMFEYGWADAARKLIVTVMEDGNVHDHAFIREVSHYLVSDIEQAIDIILAFAGVRK
jgi:nucleoside 2-deoxyribosyltransferase